MINESYAEQARIGDRIMAIRRDPKHPFNSTADTPERRAAVEEMAGLYGRLFPDEHQNESESDIAL